MRQVPRTVQWRNHEFRFETIPYQRSDSDRTPIWAVSWRGEFIGTMPAHRDETTKEFELRAVRWLADLIPA